ncbi:hypothetical protein CONPUDRAFT_78490, partial [Coniophora puteana RWD-64-598 SS2]
TAAAHQETVIVPEDDSTHAIMIASLRTKHGKPANMTGSDKLRKISGGTNWLPFKDRAESLFELFGCLHIVDGKWPITEALTPEERELWKKRDGIARYILTNSVSDDLSSHVKKRDPQNPSKIFTSAEMWKKLTDTFEIRSGQHVTELYSRLYTMRAGDEDEIGCHILELEDLRQRIAVAAGTTGRTVSDAEFQNVILISLPNSWKTWSQGYHGVEAADGKLNRTTDELIALIRAEGARRAGTKRTQKRSRGEEALHTSSGKARRGNNGNRIPQSRGCHVCKMSNHSYADCTVKDKPECYHCYPEGYTGRRLTDNDRKKLEKDIKAKAAEGSSQKGKKRSADEANLAETPTEAPAESSRMAIERETEALAELEITDP